MKIVALITFATLGILSCSNPRTNDNAAPSVSDEGISKLDTIHKNIIPVAEVPTTCPEFDFRSPQHQADSLVSIYESISQANDDTQKSLDWAFFCSFPDTFAEMRQLFGYDENLGAAPLYADGEKIIDHFKKLTSIPKEIYYNKYIDINIKGTWEADNIRDAFGLAAHIESNTRAMCHSLLKKNDDEIKSVFRFIFDGPHPANQTNIETYEKLLPLLLAENKKVGGLFTEAYNEVLAADDGHGR